jgi:hypothetical protein
VDGISVLVNDVERSRIWSGDGSSKAQNEFTWTRPPGNEANEYFRWAYLRDGLTLDYSKAGTLSSDGVWTPEEQT